MAVTAGAVGGPGRGGGGGRWLEYEAEVTFVEASSSIQDPDHGWCWG